MTRTEFDQYLESIGGLISAWNGEVITSFGFLEFNSGWYQITKDLIDDLIKLGWDKRIAQAKEKFGGGRFYISSGSVEIYDRISKWENETFKTCEDCGSKEEVNTQGPGWLRTLCKDCREKIVTKLKTNLQ